MFLVLRRYIVANGQNAWHKLSSASNICVCPPSIYLRIFYERSFCLTLSPYSNLPFGIPGYVKILSGLQTREAIWFMHMINVSSIAPRIWISTESARKFACTYSQGLQFWTWTTATFAGGWRTGRINRLYAAPFLEICGVPATLLSVRFESPSPKRPCRRIIS